MHEPIDLTHGLAQPFLVLHQGDPHVALPVLSEGPPGSHGDLCFLQEPEGVVDGAQPFQVLFGYPRLDVHPGAGHISTTPLPAGAQRTP